DLRRPVELPVRAGLFEVPHAGGLEHAPHLDRLRRRVAAVCVDQEGDVVVEGPRDALEKLFGSPRPLVTVVPALPADPDLERLEAALVAKAREPIGLLGRPDVAAHAGAVDRERTRRAAEELAHAPALALAAQVPQRGVEPA